MKRIILLLALFICPGLVFGSGVYITGGQGGGSGGGAGASANSGTLTILDAGDAPLTAPSLPVSLNLTNADQFAAPGAIAGTIGICWNGTNFYTCTVVNYAAGLNGQIQFNSNGVLGADSRAAYSNFFLLFKGDMVFRVETTETGAHGQNTPIQLVAFSDIPVSFQSSKLNGISQIAMGYTNDVDFYSYIGKTATNGATAIYDARRRAGAGEGGTLSNGVVWLGWGQTEFLVDEDGTGLVTNIPANRVQTIGIEFMRPIDGIGPDDFIPILEMMPVGGIYSDTYGPQIIATNNHKLKFNGTIWTADSLPVTLGIPLITNVQVSGVTTAGGLVTNFFPGITTIKNAWFNPTNTAGRWATLEAFITNRAVFHVFGVAAADCGGCTVIGPATAVGQ